ncbi:hypothetical protein AB9P05_22280 [Roseivirga sp. BDSF3-8]|uniref:hypothetical protein n=1 Tax=Roseivirga sp. BDSF3-8 TaxID=3241598 RepID=UPI00353265F2
MEVKLKYVTIVMNYLLAGFSLAMPFLFAEGTAIDFQTQWLWYSFFMGLFVFTIVFLWKRVLFDINTIRVNEQEVVIRNIVTRREKIILRKDLAGFTYNPWLKRVRLVSKGGKPVATIWDYYYDNLEDLISLLELERLHK